MRKQKLTKKEEGWINLYLQARDYSVDTAYGNPSSTKKQIEAEILYTMKDRFNGFDYRILSHNGFRFSCAFQVKDENGNHFLIVCTPSSWYNIVPLITVDSETGEVKFWSEYFA